VKVETALRYSGRRGVPHDLAIDDNTVGVCRKRVLTQELGGGPLLCAVGMPPSVAKLKPTAPQADRHRHYHRLRAMGRCSDLYQAVVNGNGRPVVPLPCNPGGHEAFDAQPCTVEERPCKSWRDSTRTSLAVRAPGRAACWPGARSEEGTNTARSDRHSVIHIVL
jgi:hypothetical protein